MPKVSLDPKERKQWELLRYIKGEMRQQKISQEKMAAELGMSQQGFASLLKYGDLRYSVLISVFKVLGTEDEEKARLMSL